MLTQLNQQSSGGSGPCYITVDKVGQNVLVANYGGGSVSVLPLHPDRTLGEASCFIQHQGKGSDPNRQEAPHAHSINLDLANRFAFAADLGLDKILIYRFDATAGKLTPNQPAYVELQPGSGPRHFSFDPSGKFAYVINEMLLTVTAFSYQPDKGILTEIQTTSTLPEGATGTNFSTAEVQVHPSGKFLYGSNRGHDTIAVFSIDTSTGKLTQVEHQSTRGKTPRNFGIDPSGKFLLAANQDSGNLAVFRIDGKSGRLSFLSEVKVPKPVCVKFLPPAKP
jgi:6-phosphogluconolactonase